MSVFSDLASGVLVWATFSCYLKSMQAENILRDLEWVMRCPSLLSHSVAIKDDWCVSRLETAATKLAALKRDPSPLLTHLAHRSVDRRLGAYFEALVSFWLTSLLDVKDLRERVPVRRNKKTAGEFDFLFTEPASGRSFHWEAAVKFYLYRQEDGLYHGPGGQDRLDLKVERLLEHQLKLGEREGIKDLDVRLFMKGVLFYPLQSDWRHYPATGLISGAHQRGWWTHENSQALKSFGNHSRWLVLNKPHWLAVPRTNDLLSHGDLLDACAARMERTSFPVQVVELESEAGGEYHERSRGFIVPKTWPI